MTQDYKKSETKRCSVCLQWDGPRTYIKDKDIVRVDATKEDNCRILHKKTRATCTCDKFFPF